ncbi:MAG: coproporphyrinogen dehydrogenase HemZ [Lachnospiraceae bacterium]|nr:coproporphyrinogen dehydrogenase HemZ [Lachnospiraceae bacterium]
MMNYIMRGHEFTNEVQTAIQIFFQNEKYTRIDIPAEEGLTIETLLIRTCFIVMLYENGQNIFVRSFDKQKGTPEDFNRWLVKKGVYETLKEATGIRPAWGMLTGIRPAKKANELMDEGLKSDEVITHLVEKFDVTREKAELTVEVALAEREILGSIKKDDIGIYIGIPFCPTRCLYCSFASYPLDKYEKKVDSYIDCLIKEIEYLGKYSKDKNIRNIYIGGGTPTSLNEERLERVLKAVEANFDVKNVGEYTVEAGRPDTITKEKLDIIKKYGADRISINPQTMCEKTLSLIGREHTPGQIKEAFAMAREAGFENINMDIILGLPGETENELKITLDEIKGLSPDSLTVHTLAVKRASKLKEELENIELTNAAVTENMLKISAEAAKELGMKPYYMYRQKNMVGNFENVGYCMPGKECLYNVDIMEEKLTILAAGAGATTKVYESENNHIYRIYNVKSLDDYITRIDEMIERKINDLPKEGK